MLQFADSIQKTVKTYPQAVPKTRIEWYSAKAIEQHKILFPLQKSPVHSDHHWLGKLMKKQEILLFQQEQILPAKACCAADE